MRTEIRIPINGFRPDQEKAVCEALGLEPQKVLAGNGGIVAIFDEATQETGEVLVTYTTWVKVPAEKFIEAANLQGQASVEYTG